LTAGVGISNALLNASAVGVKYSFEILKQAGHTMVAYSAKLISSKDMVQRRCSLCGKLVMEQEQHIIVEHYHQTQG